MMYKAKETLHYSQPSHKNAISIDVPFEIQVPCYHLNDFEIEETECADPYLSPIYNYQYFKPCVLPCPVPAFAEKEFSVMWSASGGIEAFGLGLNVFMALTWVIGNEFDDTNFNLKGCVFCGLLYGLVSHSV